MVNNFTKFSAFCVCIHIQTPTKLFVNEKGNNNIHFSGLSNGSLALPICSLSKPNLIKSFNKVKTLYKICINQNINVESYLKIIYFRRP